MKAELDGGRKRRISTGSQVNASPASAATARRRSQRGRRGKLSLQQIVLEEEDARAFAARLAELPRMSARMTGELHFEIERTTLHAVQ